MVVDVEIQALGSNNSTIYVGNPGDLIDISGFAGTGDEQGYALTPGDRIPFEDIDLHEIFIDAVISEDEVIWGAVIEVE